MKINEVTQASDECQRLSQQLVEDARTSAADAARAEFTAAVHEMQRKMEKRRMKRLIGRNGKVVEEEMNAATDVIDNIRRGYRDRRPLTGAEAVGVMLDALAAALSADMEQGGAAFNDAAHSEFKKKYPRFTTLFNVSRKVDWSEV